MVRVENEFPKIIHDQIVAMLRHPAQPLPPHEDQVQSTALNKVSCGIRKHLSTGEKERG